MNASNAVKQLRGFRGPLWQPDSTEYTASRLIYNMRTSDCRPRTILHALDQDDVISATRWAHDQGLPLALRSGGHGLDGTAMPDAAVVLDLTGFKAIEYDTRTARVRVGAGITLGELDRALEMHHRVVPAGTVSTTGLAGLCLGGGLGFHSRKYGATVDSLLSCKVVTTDGRALQASATENPDLFWALRGGGGNFGIVTEFEFATHALPAIVSVALICYPLTAASDTLLAVREFMGSAPRDLSLVLALSQCPPLPPIAASRHGETCLIAVVVHTGAPADGARLFAGLSALGPAIAAVVKTDSWSHINSLLDVVAPSGRRVFSRGGYLSDLNADVIGIAVDFAASAPAATALPLPSTTQNFFAMGGAITDDFAEASAAFSRQGAAWVWEGICQWDIARDDRAFESWNLALHGRMAPHLRSNGYINLTLDQGPEWRRHIWGDAGKYQRLIDAKTHWDPDNVLRFNKNVPSRSMASTGR